MIHPATTLKIVNDRIGYGVFATAPLPAGTITYAVDALDILIPAGDPRLTDELYADLIDKYGVVEADGSYTLCWDIAKYINHCCHYNSLSTGFSFCIAIRDIAAGEEITEDYGAYNLIEPMELYCHYPDCRLYATANDFDFMSERWDAEIRQALTQLRMVDQPLMPYLDQGTLRAVNHYLDTGEGYLSIRELRHQPGESPPA